MELNILIVGVGGQGTLLASRVLGKYAELTDMDCKLSEVHGMAQRGGSVVTHIKIAKKVYSPLVEVGRADIVISFERLEAMRWANYIKDGGFIICNNQEIMPMPVVTGACKYPTNVESELSSITANVLYVDALRVAEECGNIRAMNTVMLSQLCKSLGLDREIFLAALKESVPAKAMDINIEAFIKGYSI